MPAGSGLASAMLSIFDNGAFAPCPAPFNMAAHVLVRAPELADKVAQNLPLTNFAICSAVSHMNNMSGMDAAYAEAFVGGIVNTQPAARERLEAFTNKTAARVRPNS